MRKAANSKTVRRPEKNRRRSAAGESDVNDVLNGFRRIMRALRRAAGETQARFEISGAQLFVLDELHAAGRPLSINQLAQLSMTDRSSVANVVDRLVQSGYATREQAAADRRRAEVRITTKGEKLAKSAPPPPTMQLLAGLRSLSQTEIHALALGLQRLQEEMGLTQEPVRMLFEDESPPLERRGRKSR
jgi:DNA-binding MarR family transcriptional regulator